MEIYLIRHTTPVLTTGLIYGRTEVLLSETFGEELLLIKQNLPEKFNAIYSSPSFRCTELAKQINSNFITDARLTELNFGDWEGKTWDTVDQAELQIWMDDFVHVCVPGGESMMQMHERVSEFWQELLMKSYEKLAVVTHAGVIRLILAIVRKIALDKIFEIKVDYGEVIVVDCS